MEFDINVDDKAVQRALNALLKAGRDLSPAMREIADTLAETADTAFERQADPATGAPWAPLAASTLAARKRKGKGDKILIDSAQLVSSINAQSGNDFAAAVTNKIYAAIHQFGGRAGRNRSVEIPARPYFGVGPEAEDEITAILRDHLQGAFEG